jgi:hypothetical protein
MAVEIAFAVAIFLMFAAVFWLGKAAERNTDEQHVQQKTDKLNAAFGREEKASAPHPHPEVEYDPQDPGKHKP